MVSSLDLLLERAMSDEIAGFKFGDLRRRVDSLSENYRANERTGSTFIHDDLDALAYATYRMPATLAAVRAVLRQIRLRLPEWNPQTFLDVGAGTGSGLWAMAEEWPELRRSTLVDSSLPMITLGQRLVRPTEVHALREAEWRYGEILMDPRFDSSQAVLTSYVLNEVPTGQLETTVERLWDCAEELFIAIEPGTPQGFHAIKRIRKKLIELDANILVPCPHGNACPMPADDWCHFSVRLPRNQIHREVKPGRLPYEDEKFSYVVASKIPVVPARARILRHPLYRRGMVRLTLCDENGISLRTVTRGKDREIYRAARDADWGDEFPEAET
jgi:ribosomal protein RSM22 (predicted rRNA methylase)